jgi:acetoin utilization deacetylase AcuC-like enzyme
MIAALALRTKHAHMRVAIIDADQHYGDGTDDILQQLGIKDIFHYTFGRHFHSPSDAAAYLQAAAKIPAQLKAFGADVVLYQAGADVHIHDPLGGVLSTAQIAQRDELIIGGCAGLGIPLAWNLAGGYQRDENGGISKVLEIHLETARVALRALKKH